MSNQPHSTSVDREKLVGEVGEALKSREAAKAAVWVIDPDWPSFVSPMSRADMDALKNAGDAIAAAWKVALASVEEAEEDCSRRCGGTGFEVRTGDDVCPDALGETCMHECPGCPDCGKKSEEETCRACGGDAKSKPVYWAGQYVPSGDCAACGGTGKKPSNTQGGE